VDEIDKVAGRVDSYSCIASQSLPRSRKSISPSQLLTTTATTIITAHNNSINNNNNNNNSNYNNQAFLISRAMTEKSSFYFRESPF